MNPKLQRFQFQELNSCNRWVCSGVAKDAQGQRDKVAFVHDRISPKTGSR